MDCVRIEGYGKFSDNENVEIDNDEIEETSWLGERIGGADLHIHEYSSDPHDQPLIKRISYFGVKMKLKWYDGPVEKYNPNNNKKFLNRISSSTCCPPVTVALWLIKTEERTRDLQQLIIIRNNFPSITNTVPWFDVFIYWRDGADRSGAFNNLNCRRFSSESA